MPDTVGDESPEPTAALEIRLSRPQQLFKSLDRSPFHEQDLGQDAEEYNVDSGDEYPLEKPLTLIIHLPADQIQAGDIPDLAQAIHNYFAYRLRFFVRDGRIFPGGRSSKSPAAHEPAEQAALLIALHCDSFQLAAGSARRPNRNAVAH
jgi:hypothetical protein